MNLPPAGSYDSVMFFWFESHLEDWHHKVIQGPLFSEGRAKHLVSQGFPRYDGYASVSCAVTFWKDGEPLELWEQLFGKKDVAA